jgi:hydantoinase/carbamoylase family amidase
MSLHSRLEELYAIGGAVGANRAAYTAAEDEAHALVAGWLEEAGFVVSRDDAGNLFGRLRGREPQLPEVWVGSHLDSVPHGGRFDGPLGVLAGLEAAARIGRQTRTLTVVAFRDEEGWRFGRGCFGSRALCGQLEVGELDTVDAEGVSVRAAVGDELEATGWLHPPAAYLEVHIEQGPVLAGLDAPLGVVTSIVGLARIAVTFRGRAGHAGTTPMAGRDDALVKAAAFVGRVRAVAEQACVPGTQGGGAVATVGRLEVHPGAANVIPERVEVIVDARAPEEATLAAVVAAIGEAAGDAEVEPLRRTSPVPMAETVRAAFRDALAELGLPAPELHSGAGHDAGVLGAAGVPAGMLFVRSLNGGISHSPDEHSDDADVALGVEALALALRRLGTFDP